MNKNKIEHETTLEETSEGFKTPQNKSIKIIEPKAPYKNKLRGYGKTKKIRGDKNVDLLLFDSCKKQFCKYRVYMDDEIGIDRESQVVPRSWEMNEDCQSSDEIIESGIKKGMKSIKEAITKRK